MPTAESAGGLLGAEGDGAHWRVFDEKPRWKSCPSARSVGMLRDGCDETRARSVQGDFGTSMFILQSGRLACIDGSGIEVKVLEAGPSSQPALALDTDNSVLKPPLDLSGSGSDEVVGALSWVARSKTR